MHTIALSMPGPFELIIIAGLGLLLFGKRLPEVGRSLGQGIVQFKKGLREAGSDIEQVDDDLDRPARKALSGDQPAQSNAQNYKFDPYTGKPLQEARFDPYTGKPLQPDAPPASSGTQE
jgi:sec-independent protein translocase protein TatA